MSTLPWPTRRAIAAWRLVADVARLPRAWLAAWLGLLLAGGLVLAVWQWFGVASAFETDVRIAHRLLSQRAAQHDTMLATLNLLTATPSPLDPPAPDAAAPAQRLPALYPQVLGVQRRERGLTWPAPADQAAEADSRRLNRAVLSQADLAAGRYRLLQAGEPVSHALDIDLVRLMPGPADWPGAGDSAARYSLQLAAQRRVMQAGQPAALAWPLTLRKPLASASQPFELVAERWLGAADLSATAGLLWLLLMSGLLLGVAAWRRQGLDARRTEELLRLGQVARLNSLGELAAGMAHELNQPLTAVLASAQAAARVLADDEPDLALARQALQHAVAQARRASDVIARLRSKVERPDAGQQAQALSLPELVRATLQLLDPETRARQVNVELTGLDGEPAPQHEPRVLVDPVALQQVLHNLLMNALQALEQVPAGQRQLLLCIRWPADGAPACAELAIIDSGPGIAADALPRVFEPFYTTRRGGLGLGLTLCETLVLAMGGRLGAANRPAREGTGACFTLQLPLAGSTAS